MLDNLRSSRIQEMIAARVLGVIVPLSVVGSITATIAAAIQIEQRRLLFPDILVASFLILVWWIVYRGKFRLAAHMFTIGLCVSIIVGMAINGGVLAPVYVLSVVTVTITVLLYGPWIALFLCIAFIITGGLFVYLDAADLLFKVAPVPPWLLWTFIGLDSIIALSVIAIPNRMLHETLEESERRRIAAEEAYEGERNALQSLKKNRTELEKLNVRYEALFEQAGDGILLLDINGNVIAANEVFSRMHGYTEAEIMNMGIEGLDLEGTGPMPERIQRLQAGEKLKFEVMHRHKDGHTFPMAVITSLIESDGEKVIIATHHDLTERKERENYATMLGRMLDEAPASITVHDEEGHFLYANNMTLALHGYDSMEEFMALNLHDLDVPESEALIAERMQCIAQDREIRFEAEHYRKDGSILPLAIHAKLIEWQGNPALLSIASDISERKRAQEALAAESMFNRLVVQNAGQGICVCQECAEFPYIRFSVWNDSMTKITGYTLEEINRLGWYQSVYPDPEVQERAVSRMQSMREGDDIKAEEWEITRKDGEKRHLLISTCLNTDDTGKKYVLAVMSDVTKHKQAEEEVKRAYDFVGNVINSIADPIFVKNEKHQFVLINNAEVALLGRPREELIGKSDVDFFPPEQVQVFWEMDQKVLETGVENINEEAITDVRTGETRTIVTRKARYVDSLGKQFIVGISTDITERKRAEDAVKQAHDFVENIINAIADPVFVKDEEHRFVMVNNAAVSLFGYSTEELIGKNDKDFFSEDEVQVFWEMDQQVLETGIENINEEAITDVRTGDTHTIVTRKTRYIDIKGKRYIVGIIRDITERKKYEEAIRVSEERFRTAVECVSNFIYERDMTTGEAEFFGDLDGCLGYEPGAFPRSLNGWLENIHPEDFAQVLETLQQASGRGEQYTLDYRLRRSDGTYANWQETGVFLQDETGTPTKCIGSANDVTEKKKEKAEREKIEEQLRQAQKMEAVGLLAGGVAHEFNNLLQVILGLVEMVQLDVGVESANGRLLEDVNRAGKRAAELTQELLAFSRRQTLMPVNVDLNALVDGEIKMLRPLIGANIDVHFIPSEEINAIRADKRQIEVVLMNLCINARDAMPHGGILTIETELVALDEAFCKKHENAKQGNYARLSVTDTGKGMDEKKLAQIFDPFFTTKEVGEGTGLGLATVYGIIAQHKGTIDVVSELGKGTTFSVYLPLAEGPVDEERPKKRRRRLGPGGRETILVAEDDEMLLSLLEKILTKSGYSVLLARNGEEALGLYEEHADKIDMALLDVIMPLLGGQHVMEKIQEVAPDMKFLFSSGYSENAIQTDFIIKDGLRLIKKPYKSSELLQAVRDTLDMSKRS